MGFIKKSKVASIISLGGVCSGLFRVANVGAMEESFEVGEGPLSKLNELLSNGGKSNLKKSWIFSMNMT